MIGSFFTGKRTSHEPTMLIILHITPEKHLNAHLAIRERGRHWVLWCENDVGLLTPVGAFLA
eukprot:262288-Pelagomonas_calceolata.AAC.1